MKLSNSQLKLIALLNLVIIGLLIGAVFIVAHFRPANTENLPAYSRVRTGTISLNPYLGWELELLGSNDEDIVFTYIYNETIYVFGNSLSNDLDFEGPCFFLVMIDTFGKLNENSYFYYGADRLVCVQMSNDGFILAVEGQKPYLLVINLQGEIIKKVDSFMTAFENIAQFRPYLDGWLLFTRPFNASRSTYGLRCIFFDQSLNFMFSNLATSLYSLEHFEIVLTSNGPIAFCNATNALNTTYPAIVEFPLSSSARVNVIETHAGAASGFSVHDGQYLLLTAYQGCSFIKINARFEVTSTIALGLAAPTFFIDLDSLYFAVFTPSSIYIFNENLVKISTLNGYTPHDYKYVNNGVLFSGTDSSNNLLIYLFQDGQLKKQALIGQGQNSIITLNSDGLFCVYINAKNIQICSLRQL